MTRKRLLIIAIVLAVAAVLAWQLAQRREAAAGARQPRPENPVSALVQTRPLRKASLANDRLAFGEVATGRLEAVSFARAGQVSRLLVLPGQRVARGAPLATLTSDPNAQAAYAQAANALRFAQDEEKRIEDLFALQLATRSQVDGARKTLHDAQAALAAQRRLGGGLDAATVTAPFDGVVTAINVAQGDRIQPGAPILQLGHADTLRVQLGIEPVDRGLVRPGMPVTLSPVQDESQTIDARITMLQDMIDPKTRLLNALVELPPQPARLLAPGMAVRAVIHAGRREGWALPRQAVLADDRGSYVFQVENGKAHRVAVTKEGESDGEVAVSGALKPGLPVVVLGNYELQDGMAVREDAR